MVRPNVAAVWWFRAAEPRTATSSRMSAGRRLLVKSASRFQGRNIADELSRAVSMCGEVVLSRVGRGPELGSAWCRDATDSCLEPALTPQLRISAEAGP